MKPNVLHTPWYDKTVRAMQLAGMSDRTQECYARAVRMLIQFYGKEPSEITEKELADHFLHRRNVDKWQPATMKICYCGIKFFFIHVPRKEWPLFRFLRARTEKRLPCGLTHEDALRILKSCHHIS